MRHQIFKSTQQLAKLACRDLIYPSFFSFRYCVTCPGTYSCRPPPLCQHRYLTAHPWTWCWCFTDTRKTFQSHGFQHKRMNVLVLNTFGNLPDGWCPHSSFYVLYVIEETALKTHTICSICFIPKGKLFVLQDFFNQSWVEVIPCKNQLAIKRLKAVCLHIQMSVCTHRYLASPSVWTQASVQFPLDTEIHRNTELEEYELSYWLGDKFCPQTCE